MAGASVGGPFLVVRQAPPSRTLMRTLFVKRQTTPQSGFLRFFRFPGPGVVDSRSHGLT